MRGGGKTATGTPHANVLPGASFVSPHGIKTPHHLIGPFARPQVRLSLPKLRLSVQISINGNFDVFYSGVIHSHKIQHRRLIGQKQRLNNGLLLTSVESNSSTPMICVAKQPPPQCSSLESSAASEPYRSRRRRTVRSANAYTSKRKTPSSTAAGVGGFAASRSRPAARYSSMLPPASEDFESRLLDAASLISPQPNHHHKHIAAATARLYTGGAA